MAGISQSAYEIGHAVSGPDVESQISQAMYLYLTKDLGLREGFSRARSEAEMQRAIPKSVAAYLISEGIELKGRTVLDLGAGLGGMSEELVLQGATTFAIEPGRNWALLAERRAGRHGPYVLERTVGESLGFDDESFDVVVSLQVLEHVQDPRKVLAEVFRVLKPGGYFYLACENYLAFKEGHYKILWFPMMPKWLGAIYLRVRGRSPKFLLESVTYVTFPQILRWCEGLGFERCRDRDLPSPRARWLDRLRRRHSFGVQELFYKALR